ncbi:cytotoxic T-lymphocyte protein 4 isoform X2 [Anabas testudineus]|uniref:cytotoxic T-lymphocyte protein 4 isoform X2 n=1 Tax=Anabas testudineus TaxID=64144 RepID=UPI000E45804E|nr:cytotoxic T-lymphocyte protein 4 isoform X2 [Anabas testudineus]
MFLTHYMMEWIVLTVLCLCLPVWSDVTVIQPYKVVSNNGTAKVQCVIQPRPAYHQVQSHDEQSAQYPHPDPEEFRVTLLKGLQSSQEICSSMVQCTAQVREGAVEVTVSGLKATDTDIYRCDIEIFYPPPYLRLIGNGSLIHVLDSCAEQAVETHIAQQSDEDAGDENDETLSSVGIPVVVLVILIICVLILIIYFQTVQCERGKREVVRTVPGGAHKVDAVEFSYENIA